jgi:uncharacterized protein
MAPNPLRQKGYRGTAPPAVLSLLDDVQRHRRRRDALHPGPWRRQRDLWGFLSSLLDKALLLHDLGWSVLLFDYRGYGASAGKPTEEGTYADMAAAVEHLRGTRGVAPERLVLYGESLGGAVAVEAASRGPAGALVVDSSFTGLRDMAHHYYPWLPAWLLRFRYDSLSRMPSVRCPVLVLHSPQDDVVPYAMGRALYDAAPGPKRFQNLVGGHNDGGLVASPDAQRELGAFLREVIPAT